jgi:hypothetical protein
VPLGVFERRSDNDADAAGPDVNLMPDDKTMRREDRHDYPVNVRECSKAGHPFRLAFLDLDLAVLIDLRQPHLHFKKIAGKGFLATLGANAPFIGLFGTVIGILQAFDALGRNTGALAGAVAPQAVMSSIAEALVATAIGLGVAIPAVFAFNMLERSVKGALDDAQVLSLEILSYLQGRPTARESRPLLGRTTKSAIVLS